MCQNIHNNCPEFKEKILFLVINEKGKYEYQHNPDKKCFNNVLLPKEGIKKSLCKYHRWGDSKYGYCQGAIGEDGEQLTHVREGYEFTPI